jgi:hypothetical protein
VSPKSRRAGERFAVHKFKLSIRHSRASFQDGQHWR